MSIEDANNHKRTYSYDKKNRLTEITDPLGNKTEYVMGQSLVGDQVNLTTIK